MIEESLFCGAYAVIGSNDVLEATVVPSWGSNLIRLRHKSSGIDIFRTPESAEAFWNMPVLYGVPILFPPNRIENGVFEYDGKTYRFHLNEPAEHNHSHGVLFDRPWKLLSAKMEDERIIIETEICSGDDPWIFEQISQHFRVRMMYTLTGNKLEKTITVVNESEGPLPCGIGFHTTFRYPLAPDGSVERCRFSLSAKEQWLLNDRFLPTGERRKLADDAALRKGISLADYAMDDVFTADWQNGNEAVLEDPDASLRIVYRADEHFKFWVVYNADAKQGYLCPEPYTWVTNAPNLQLPSEETGFRALPPGAKMRAKCEIIIEGIR